MPDFGGGGDGGSRLPITLALKVNTGVTPTVVTDVAYIYTVVTTVTARLCSWRLCSSNHDANYVNRFLLQNQPILVIDKASNPAQSFYFQATLP